MSFFVVNNTRFDLGEYAYGEHLYIKYNTGPAKTCRECGNILTNREWLSPYEIKVSKKKLGDVIYGTWNHFIVSQKFKDIYEQNNCTGITSFNRVIIYFRGKQLDEKYYYTKLILSEVKTNLIKSNVKIDKQDRCNTCQLGSANLDSIDRLIFENEEIITEDIFATMILPGHLIFSERLKKLTENLNNITFTEANDFSLHF